MTLSVDSHTGALCQWSPVSQLGEVSLYKDAEGATNISKHISNIFREGELEKSSVVRKFRTTAADGKQYLTAHYNLDMILSVGYRVKSKTETQFRIWATDRLRDYLVTGFAINPQRLEELGQVVKILVRANDELIAQVANEFPSDALLMRMLTQELT